MKTISNQTCNEMKAVLSTFTRAKVASTSFVDAQRRAGLILKKLDDAIDNTEAKKGTGSQKKAIETMLLQGESVTPKDARQLCGCERLGARIWDLRHTDGYGDRIVTTMVENPDGNRYASYRLVNGEK